MNFFSIGKVLGHHGLEGDVKIKALTENPDLYDELTHLVLSKDDEIKRSLRIRDIKYYNKYIIVQLESIESIEDVKFLKGMDVVVPENYLPETDPDEVYWYKIKNSEVIDEYGNNVGILCDYFETGAFDIFRILKDDGNYSLISNNPDHVKEIDVKEKVIYINSAGLVSEEI